MAEVAIEFLLSSFKQQLLYHAHLITGAKEEIENLEKDLYQFTEFLNRPLTIAQDRNLCDVVYEVEDVIDTFITNVLEKNSTSSSCFKYVKHAAKLHSLGGVIPQVKTKVERVKTEMATFNSPVEVKSGRPEERQPRHTGVVGFSDVTAELVHRLTKETDHLDVVSLIGSFGMGKTTLAWTILDHPEISKKFQNRCIWLFNHHKSKDKDIFLEMLKKFTSLTEDIRSKEEKEIIRILVPHLKSESFLIVMDNVWTTDDWDRLKNVLSFSNNKGKVLITTRFGEVGRYACGPKGLLHYLRPFTQKESWELLRLEVLRELKCPRELESIGEVIASGCDGLPLAVVTIGRIIAKKYSTEEGWKEVSEKVSVLLNRDEHMKRSISLSFDELPRHLRTCFLYLGTMFPKGYEIPAWKLIQMWIGEGFVKQSTDDDSSLEKTGEEYLEDLISRSMVRVKTVKTNGKVKTCRVYDVVHEFCQTQARDENFFHEIKSVKNASIDALTSCRRLFVDSGCLKFINSKSSAPRVRSFICCSKDEGPFELDIIPDIVKAFKLVRVFDAKPIKFPKVNSDLFQLVHVRYIALSFNSSTLPSKLSQLLNLQTLIVDTTSKTLKVEADIWKLMQLILFKTNASATLLNPSKDSKYGEQLQTLGVISAKNCTDELVIQAPNLKKLGVCGQLALLFKGKEGSFDTLGKMKKLENLKLKNDRSEGIPNSLPPAYKFPSRLTSLTLRATFLDWNNMSTLGQLLSLKVLKLKDKAFMGERFEIDADGCFLLLEFLHIEDTNLKVWAASAVHYPKLKGLVLRKCAQLLAVPIKLADIESFQALKLYKCELAVQSARNIKKAKKEAHAAFKLSPIDD